MVNSAADSRIWIVVALQCAAFLVAIAINSVAFRMMIRRLDQCIARLDARQAGSKSN
jgi:hypothetical protein